MLIFNDNNLDKRKIMVMSEDTWNSMKIQMLETAPMTDDPIGHLARFSGIDIYIDNDLPHLAVEVYEKWLYDAIQENRKNMKLGE